MKDMYALSGSPGLRAALGLTGTADDPGTRDPHDKGKIIKVNLTFGLVVELINIQAGSLLLS